MENSKHTPGPWLVRVRVNQTPQVWDGETGIASIVDRGQRGNGQNEANARLIAAAPALLEALRGCADLRCISKNDQGDVCTVTFTCVNCAASSRARAAIAQATGEYV